MKKIKKEGILIKAYKYPLLLSKTQKAMVERWMEQEKWIYNSLIQKRQYLESLKKFDSKKYEKEYRKGFPKTSKGKDQFSWGSYWSCIYKEIKALHPDLSELPSTCVEATNTGTIANVFKAYDRLRKSATEKKKGGRKRKKRSWHPEEKKYRDETSLAVSVGQSATELAKGVKPQFSILMSGGSSARITGFDKIAKSGKSLKIHYPKNTIYLLILG
jgi:hypothetical protein